MATGKQKTRLWHSHGGKNPSGVAVLVDSDWALDCGLRTFFPQQLQAPVPKHFVVSAADYDLSDGSFVAITCYPEVLGGRWMKLFIPRQNVRGILISENFEDVRILGLAVAGELKKKWSPY